MRIFLSAIDQANQLSFTAYKYSSEYPDVYYR